ncbi:HAD-IA family hydrolase [Streptomyces sp. NPDC002917]|uniref:HAD-IA family hydrolase n=1 Tax=Streptomyces sp. NPDC002917 TaxID=3364671 RepID=UPI00368DF9E5
MLAVAERVRQRGPCPRRGPSASPSRRGCFDVHIISETVGMAMPDPAIYRLTLDRLGLPGQACVFVDDHR